MKQKQPLTPDKYIINKKKTKINVNIFFLMWMFSLAKLMQFTSIFKQIHTVN